MINIIVAYSRNRGIGINNMLPWNLKNDMRRFKFLTIGMGNNAVIMGRKTWDSLPKKPLPNRTNIVVSKTIPDTTPGCVVKRNLNHAIAHTEMMNYSATWILGGEQIYNTAITMHHVSNVLATEIDRDYVCDKYFTELPNNFEETYSTKWMYDNDIKYRYVQYRNMNPLVIGNDEEIICL
jgi:dihydrofolate reductase